MHTWRSLFSHELSSVHCMHALWHLWCVCTCCHVDPRLLRARKFWVAARGQAEVTGRTSRRSRLETPKLDQTEFVEEKGRRSTSWFVFRGFFSHLKGDQCDWLRESLYRPRRRDGRLPSFGEAVVCYFMAILFFLKYLTVAFDVLDFLGVQMQRRPNAATMSSSSLFWVSLFAPSTIFCFFVSYAFCSWFVVIWHFLGMLLEVLCLKCSCLLIVFAAGLLPVPVTMCMLLRMLPDIEELHHHSFDVRADAACVNHCLSTVPHT